MQLPIYVINLDRRPDRWEAITADLERLGLEATRIPGVEAVELIERDKEAREKGNSPLLSINPGSAACMIGHSEALTRLIESDFPAALILEDDAELASDTPSLLQSTDWWPEGSLLIRLEHGSGKKRFLRQVCGATPTGRDLRRLERWMAGSAAYLVNRRGAAILLDAFRRPTKTVDHTIFNLQVSPTARRLRTAQIVPAMARQRRNDESDIAGHRPERKLQGLKLHAYKVGLALKRLPYRTRLLGPRLTGAVRKMQCPYCDAPPEATARHSRKSN
ncbi:MAG: glycosyltransferase family 25 protein [Rhodospirillaceae bacterium]|nr:glycosyltransferase family 25 protein [Rhodospirillaceae bacterium]